MSVSGKKVVVTSYEHVAIVNVRAKQLEDSAEAAALRNVAVKDPVAIAEEEFRERRLPYCIERKYPNGTIEYISLAHPDTVYINDTTTKPTYEQLDKIYH